MTQRAEEEQQSGRKKPGCKPVPPEQKINHDRKANTTDPDSCIMKTRQGYVQGYNAQAIVTADQGIVSAETTQQENDVHQLVPMLAAMEATLDAAGIEEHPQALAAGHNAQETHDAQGADQCGTSDLPVAQSDGGTGVRPDQKHHGLQGRSPSRSGGGPVGMVADLRLLQPGSLYRAAYG